MMTECEDYKSRGTGRRSERETRLDNQIWPAGKRLYIEDPREEVIERQPRLPRQPAVPCARMRQDEEASLTGTQAALRVRCGCRRHRG